MIAILLAAQITSSAPPLSPAEAARILAASPGASNWTHILPSMPLEPQGPTVTIADSSPTAGPYGEFPPEREPRRLDGSYYSDPNWYSPSYYPSYFYGYGAGNVYDSRRHSRSYGWRGGWTEPGLTQFRFDFGPGQTWNGPSGAHRGAPPRVSPRAVQAPPPPGTMSSGFSAPYRSTAGRGARR